MITCRGICHIVVAGLISGTLACHKLKNGGRGDQDSDDATPDAGTPEGEQAGEPGPIPGFPADTEPTPAPAAPSSVDVPTAKVMQTTPWAAETNLTWMSLILPLGGDAVALTSHFCDTVERFECRAREGDTARLKIITNGQPRFDFSVAGKVMYWTALARPQPTFAAVLYEKSGDACVHNLHVYDTTGLIQSFELGRLPVRATWDHCDHSGLIAGLFALPGGLVGVAREAHHTTTAATKYDQDAVLADTPAAFLVAGPGDMAMRSVATFPEQSPGGRHILSAFQAGSRVLCVGTTGSTLSTTGLTLTWVSTQGVESRYDIPLTYEDGVISSRGGLGLRGAPVARAGDVTGDASVFLYTNARFLTVRPEGLQSASSHPLPLTREGDEEDYWAPAFNTDLVASSPLELTVRQWSAISVDKVRYLRLAANGTVSTIVPSERFRPYASQPMTSLPSGSIFEITNDFETLWIDGAGAVKKVPLITYGTICRTYRGDSVVVCVRALPTTDRVEVLWLDDGTVVRRWLSPAAVPEPGEETEASPVDLIAGPRGAATVLIGNVGLFWLEP